MRADSARHWAEQLGGSEAQRLDNGGWASRIAADSGVDEATIVAIVESLTVPIDVNEATIAFETETPVV